MNNHQANTFDRDLGLTELLGNLQVGRLQTLLANLLGETVSLLDANHKPLLENKVDINLPHTPLRWQLDIVAWLVSNAPTIKVEAAVALLEQLFLHNARYLMAADLHAETLQTNYEDLQQQHFSLQQSEVRYRELSEQLEQRVAKQVQTIETAQRILINTEKMAAIGQLAAGIAHEINNPLGFISSNLRTAKEYLEQMQQFSNSLVVMVNNTQAKDSWAAAKLDDVMQDFPQLLNECTDGTNRVSAIIANLRSATELEQKEQSQTDINQIIQDSYQLAKDKLGENISVTLQLGELPETRCYANQLAQAYMHLLLNAARACAIQADKNKSNSEIGIHTSCDKNTIIVTFVDNGCGISTAQLSRVFEPFYTTCEVGQGTGLGLTVCRDIIQAHNGRIEINSELGVGTTVEIILPVLP